VTHAIAYTGLDATCVTGSRDSSCPGADPAQSSGGFVETLRAALHDGDGAAPQADPAPAGSGSRDPEPDPGAAASMAALLTAPASLIRAAWAPAPAPATPPVESQDKTRDAIAVIDPTAAAGSICAPPGDRKSVG
jgi:hypothetical protein